MKNFIANILIKNLKLKITSYCYYKKNQTKLIIKNKKILKYKNYLYNELLVSFSCKSW